jgi:GTP-binding protein
VIAAQQERHRRVTTGELNRFFREVVASHPPPRQGGKRPQLYFVSQPLIRPPTFVFASNRMDRVHFSYARYLQNALRQRYGFGGTPLWLKFRQRSSKPR